MTWVLRPLKRTYCVLRKTHFPKVFEISSTVWPRQIPLNHFSSCHVWRYSLLHMQQSLYPLFPLLGQHCALFQGMNHGEFNQVLPVIFPWVSVGLGVRHITIYWPTRQREAFLGIYKNFFSLKRETCKKWNPFLPVPSFLPWTLLGKGMQASQDKTRCLGELKTLHQ